MQYSAWKYILLIFVLIFSTIYALPNLYPDEPAVQISGATAGTTLTPQVLKQAENILKQNNISHHNGSFDGKSALVRVQSSEDQLKAQDLLRREMGENYVVALNLAQTTPKWLRDLNANPMKLGLDLRGGVHFLLEVDLSKMLSQRLDSAASDVRRSLRKEKIAIKNLTQGEDGLLLHFSDADKRDDAQRIITATNQDFSVQPLVDDEGAALSLKYSQNKLNEITEYAMQQNLTTMRNRINELGVAEAIVQSQGTNRILIELPGVQDTAEAKRVLGRTANLEFRMVSDKAENYTGGIAPTGTEAFPFKTLDGSPVLLERQTIVTGEKVQNAQAGRDENGGAKVDITLDTGGGRLMQNATSGRVGKQMAVLFIENKQKITYEKDPATGKTKEIRTPYAEKKIINRATVQAVLGSQFQITGLDSPEEAAELALLLRAGALAAPMYFVEERTIGPSLGKENIEKGQWSTVIGLALVVVIMVLVYKLFGLFAVCALLMNIAMMFAAMSLIGGVLSLPGIAGIVLTIGMAVDANVLIFERIREEFASGSSPKHAIMAGFDRAFTTILDANLTTFLVAFILFAVGSGPIKGFAVTLSIGILCSMFTAIIGTRALAQIFYAKRNVDKLSI